MAPSKSKSSSAPGTSARRAEKAPAPPPPEEPSQRSDSDEEEVSVSPTKSRSGRQAGALNFSDDEIYVLLDIMDDIKPTGALAWGRVAGEYNINVAPERQRSTNSLEQKYRRVSTTFYDSGAKLTLD
jgi:hypothetical protein